jgi:hypothetical protein
MQKDHASRTEIFRAVQRLLYRLHGFAAGTALSDDPRGPPNVQSVIDSALVLLSGADNGAVGSVLTNRD